MRRAAIAIATAAAAALGLTACSGGGTTAPATSAPTTYSTVTEVRDAMVEAGGTCEDWIQDNVVHNASQSGHCGTGTTISLYLSRAAAEAQVQYNKDSVFGSIDSTWLVGENWIINASDQDVDTLHSKLGGDIVTFGDATK